MTIPNKKLLLVIIPIIGLVLVSCAAWAIISIKNDKTPNQIGDTTSSTSTPSKQKSPSLTQARKEDSAQKDGQSETSKSSPKPMPVTSPSPSPVPQDTATQAENTTPATPETPQPTSKLLYSGDFETGDLSQWYNNQSCPGAITVVTDPVRSGRYAARFSVTDNDTNASCPKSPTADPRAQLIANYQFAENDDVYISMPTYFPADFPNINDWLVVGQIYGPPYGGSPTMALGVKNDRLVFDARFDNRNHNLWTSAPIAKGKAWENIVLHIKLSPDRNIGFVELLHNGTKQTLSNGQERYNYPTLIEGLNWTGPGGYNYLYAQQYRSRNTALGTVVLYHDDFKVGTTYESVQ